MVKIIAQHWLLVKYARFDMELNLDYDSPDTNLKLVTKEYDTEDASLLKPDEVLVENVYISNDPAQKGWFTPYKSYVPPVPLGSVAPAQGLGRVLLSKSEKYRVGDWIMSRDIGWATHNVVSAKGELTSRPDPKKVPHIVKYMSALGGATMTSYMSAFKYSGVSPETEGKTWLITGAAGAAGSALVQIVAKVFRPKRIIGVAGGAEKCRWVETLGDNVVCLDYKSKSYKKDFKKTLGKDEIDVFVDHVGGWILAHAFPSMAVHGKVVQVGAIAGYNDNNFVFNTYNSIITKRVTIQGMVITDDNAEIPKAFKDLVGWFANGTLDINNFEETIVQAIGEDFKKVPELWTGLFKGTNKGKYITQVGEYNTGAKL